MNFAKCSIAELSKITEILPILYDVFIHKNGDLIQVNQGYLELSLLLCPALLLPLFLQYLQLFYPSSSGRLYSSLKWESRILKPRILRVFGSTLQGACTRFFSICLSEPWS